MLEKLIAWRKNEKRKMKDGIELIKAEDSKYTTFLRENDDAEQGSYAFNLLDKRVERLIRILSQNSKKKAEVTEKSQDKELTKEEEAAKLMILAKAAQTRADKAVEAADKENDPEKRKELEAKAETALQKAEDAMKKAKEFSEALKK